MRILGLLLIALIAIGLYFAPRLSTRAQQKQTVAVQPRPAANQPGIPEVKAVVDRSRVPLGDKVTFTLSPAHVVTDSRYKVTLFFGDRARQVMHSPQVAHVYTDPGNYTYSILVEPAAQDAPTPNPVVAIPGVKLTATPAAVEVSRPVTFAAQLSHRYPNIRFRFVFGDGLDTGWQTEAGATHAYSSAGTYQAYVDLGIDSNGSIKPVGGSKRQSIQISKPSPPIDHTVKLFAGTTSVKVAQPVTFTARINPPEVNASYRFDFGDQSGTTDWQIKSQVQHRYTSAGKYSVRVEVRVTTRSTNGTQSVAGNPLTIEVSDAAAKTPAVDLQVIPENVPLGVPVYFRAIPAVADSQARYRFNFGDGSSPGNWSSEPVQTHVYISAGSYPAYVEMAMTVDEPIKAAAVSTQRRVRVTPIGGLDNGNVNVNSNTSVNGNSNNATNANVGNGNSNSNAARNSNANGNSNSRNGASANSSPTVSPSATETPPPSGSTEPSDWWKYVIIALIILFVVYQASSYVFAPRPTFVPHFDPGKSRVGADKPLGIDLQVDVDPNVAAGEFKLDTLGRSFIESERTER